MKNDIDFYEQLDGIEIEVQNLAQRGLDSVY